jgi:hypothetical protein
MMIPWIPSGWSSTKISSNRPTGAWNVWNNTYNIL